ncbi:MAG: DUF1894 domain-containing protein [Methanobrevibacter sp.]|jgi:hypothetical protein|nr:DUF1894 domain-containing protein [Methanobrevibacter sp.]
MAFCLETYLQQSDDYEIFTTRAGFKECAKIIEEKAVQILYINPGDKVLGARIIGLPPIPIGVNIEKGTIILPYTKPCHGTSVIEVPAEEEEFEHLAKISIKKK